MPAPATGVPIIETPRLRLRPLRMSDADRIVTLIDDFEIARWLTRVPHPYTPDDAQEFLTAVVGGDDPVWAIEGAIEPTGGLIGVIGIDATLGYWLGRSWWARGYITEAVAAVVAVALADPARSDIAAAYFVGNDRSRRALERAGFVDTSSHTIASVALGHETDGRDMGLTCAAWCTARAL